MKELTDKQKEFIKQVKNKELTLEFVLKQFDTLEIILQLDDNVLAEITRSY